MNVVYREQQRFKGVNEDKSGSEWKTHKQDRGRNDVLTLRDDTQHSLTERQPA